MKGAWQLGKGWLPVEGTRWNCHGMMVWQFATGPLLGAGLVLIFWRSKVNYKEMS